MMRTFVTFFPVPALLPASLSAQSVSASGAATTLHDTRPFGKYLVQVRSLSYGGSLDCRALAIPHAAALGEPLLRQGAA
jgi:hypothetical protein